MALHAGRVLSFMDGFDRVLTCASFFVSTPFVWMLHVGIGPNLQDLQEFRCVQEGRVLSMEESGFGETRLEVKMEAV